jgi:hypothetical protein
MTTQGARTKQARRTAVEGEWCSSNWAVLYLMKDARVTLISMLLQPLFQRVDLVLWC